VLVQTAGDIPEEAEMFWLGVLIGLFLGTAFGVLVMCMLSVTGGDE
jgi:Na+/H+ antiporter NhaA